MEEGYEFTRNTRQYKLESNNRHKIPHRKTTEQILQDYSDIEIDRIKRINLAFRRADALAKELDLPTILTSFIIDTGAGLNLKCYAHGLSTREINDLAYDVC